MSMLNRRTQPLDPAVLQSLVQAQPAPQVVQPAQTTPLRQPSTLVDVLAPTSARRNDVPAQSASITGMLTTPPAATSPMTASPTANSAPPAAVSPTAAPAAPALNARLSETEAELLLDVSSKLADARMKDPAAFNETMAALQALNTNSSGGVDFSTLTQRQQQLLSNLGMTPQNTMVIFQQLYHLLLPESQQETSQAFKKVQASLTSFVSNLDLRESTVSRIQSQARDLAAVQGVVSNLSASSITDLLADQTASVYDLAVGRITSQNFEIRSGMDYTLGHMMVLSQQSPQTLQQVESLIQKVKDEKTLDATETGLLKRYGLDLNSQNKLQTLDGNILDFNAVKQLENVIYSMKDPSEGYSKVLQASAAVIAQSRKLEDITMFARQQTQQVAVTTQEVVQTTQNLEQIRQDANQIDADLKFAQFQATHLSDALDSAAGIFGDVKVDPRMLSQWQIQIVRAPQGLKFFVADKEVTRLEMLSHLGQLLQQQQQEILSKADELARKKTEALTTTAQLGATTEKLEDQKTELKATEQIIAQETATLKRLEDERKQVVREQMPNLSSEEKALVETQIEPMVSHHVEKVVKEAEAAKAEITLAVAKAETAIIQSRAVQAAVASDAQTWSESIQNAQVVADRIGEQLAKLPELKKQATDGSQPASRTQPVDTSEISEAGLAPVPVFKKSMTGPLDPESPEVRAQLRQIDQARANKRLEESYMDQNQRKRFFDKNAQQLNIEQDRAKTDRERFQQEVNELRS